MRVISLGALLTHLAYQCIVRNNYAPVQYPFFVTETDVSQFAFKVLEALWLVCVFLPQLRKANIDQDWML